MRILIFFGLIILTHCGVRKDPIAQHTQKGPHSNLLTDSEESQEDRK